MSVHPGIELPPGFERMSRSEQLDYVQSLWEYLDPEANEPPAPAWQVEMAERRLDEYFANPDQARTSSDVRRSILEKLARARGQS